MSRTIFHFFILFIVSTAALGGETPPSERDRSGSAPLLHSESEPWGDFENLGLDGDPQKKKARSHSAPERSELDESDVATNIVRDMIEANRKDSQLPAFMRAALLGQADILQTLIHDVNIDAKYENHEKKPGMTALMYASLGGSEDAVKTLLRFGAKVNERNHRGGSALTMGVINGNERCLRLLVGAGADISHSLHDGFSSLGLAARHKRTPALRILLEHAEKRPVNLEEVKVVQAYLSKINDKAMTARFNSLSVSE